MHIDYLIRMANDIAAFFVVHSDDTADDTAADNIRQHIKRYWDPRMKAQIVAHFDETRGAGMEGPVFAAIKALAAEWKKDEKNTTP